MSQDIERALAVLTVEHKLIAPNPALRLIQESRTHKKSLVSLIQAAIPESDLLRAIASEMGWRFFDMHARDQELIIDEDLLRKCDPRVLSEHSALPVKDKSGRIVGAMANPLDVDIVQYFRSRFPEMNTYALVPKTQVQNRLLYMANNFEGNANNPTAVPEFVDYLFQRAVADGASDIHLRFLHDGTLMVRLRVDGVLRQIPFPLKGREVEVTAALMAKCPTMDSSNVREPQDGTFSLTVSGRSVDARVGMLPQISGPNLTVRILDPLTLRRRVEDMGFDQAHVEQMRAAVASPQGCVLVVGPTGSGKTTTLYALLREVDAVSRNVLTVEDPVEYRLPYVGQTQIRADLGERSLTFAKALRSIVRQDPDVILVGEIRDEETARVAMDASITGHMVLTTVHASSAPLAYLRLSEMGVPSFLVADAISLVVSQRLVRKVHECATFGPPTTEELDVLAKLGVTDIDRVPHSTGCAGCSGQGFRGRLAVAEMLATSPDLRAAVAAGETREKIIEVARRTGWRPMAYDAVRLLKQGVTTVSEIARAVSGEDNDG